ncbi:hypothetical protein [Streptomyces albipurpureus]|uniref:Gliding motility protein n=1 Tax=Streptomyces albipurpureus TaxID=2897419 RepID=A0ABT0UK82_9ACTN|nr:hypothetical protein [Streptomyces sp. CWNU-1]MCM2388419.1 hypothetical protein [Streptomyces sp. CWNU-1]
MGVFARFLRKSKDVGAPEGSGVDESAAGSLTKEPEADSGTGAEASTDAAAQESKVTEPDADVAEEAKAPVTEGVEIPRQQSAGEAADSEAGEGARK